MPSKEKKTVDITRHVALQRATRPPFPAKLLFFSIKISWSPYVDEGNTIKKKISKKAFG